MKISHNYYSRVIAYEQSLLNGPIDPAREVKNAKNSSARKDSVVITCRYTWEDLRKWAEEHNSSAIKDDVVFTCRYPWEDHTNELGEILPGYTQIEKGEQCRASLLDEVMKRRGDKKSLDSNVKDEMLEYLKAYANRYDEIGEILPGYTQIEKGEQCRASLLDEVMKRRGDKSQLDSCVKDEMLEYLKAYTNRYDEIMQKKAEGESVVEEMELEKFQKEREEQLKQLDLEFAKIAKLYEKEVHDSVDYAKHTIEYQKDIRALTSRMDADLVKLDKAAERAKKFLQQDIPNHIANRLIRMKDYIVKQYAKEGKDQFQHRIFF